MTKFCINCGSKNVSVGSIIKFCSSCGNPIDRVAESKRPEIPTPRPKKSVSSKRIDEDEEYDEESDTETHDFDINNIEIEVPIKKQAGVSMADVIKQGPTQGFTPRPKEKKINKKQFLKDWADQAGSLKDGHGKPIDID